MRGSYREHEWQDLVFKIFKSLKKSTQYVKEETKCAIKVDLYFLGFFLSDYF